MSKTIIVTGAASLCGMAIIQALADEGHGVVAIIDPINEVNMAAAKELQQTDNVELVEADIKNAESVKSGYSFIIKRYGHIDILINTESAVVLEEAGSIAIEDLQEVFNFNVCGPLRSFKAVIPVMRRNNEGLLININSGISYFSAPFVTAFSIAKAGLEMLTDGLFREVKGFGIESVNLWTGYYPLELYKGLHNEENPMSDPDLEKEKLKLGELLSDKNSQGKKYAESVAALVLDLINMKQGTRPQRCNLNPKLSDAEAFFENAKQLAALEWSEMYEINS